MIKRQNKLTATLRKTLVLFLVGVLLFTGAVSTGALEWNGDSSTGSSTGRPVEDNSFWVSSSALSDLSNIVVAWRFTFYDKNGDKPYKDTNNGSGGDGVKYVEIWLPNTSEDFWDSSNYYWISSVVNTSGGNIKYSKLDFAQAAAAGKIAPGPLKLVDRSYSAARNGCWLFGSTNWFDQFGGFRSEIPASSSAIGSWCTDPQNANTLALALGCPNGTAGMRPGDVIVVEPVFWQQANGERVAATASEFASMGALYAGLDSDGLVYSVEGTTDGTWGATCRYTNLKYPTYLYTPDGMGLWNNAVLKSGASDFDKLYTMREIMTGGYGVGIAFGIPKAVSYTLTVKPNGGTWNGTTGTSSFTIDSGSTKTIANPTRTGYTFAGWTVSGGGSISGTTYTQGDGDCTLTAKWTANNYTLTVNPNGGSWNSTTSNSSFTLAYGGTKTIANPTRTGYTFAGWTVSGSGSISGTTYTQGAGNCTLTAKWTVNNYTLTVNPNGGSWNSSTSNSSFTLAYGSTKTIANPTRTGYTFAGWTVTGSGSISGTTYTQGAGNCTLTAKWTPNTIKLTLDAKGGSGHTTTLYFKYGINKFYTDAACTNQITAITRPTRTGYTYDTDMGFYGDGSSGGVNGERYIAYGGVEFAGDLCTDIYKDATLYCQWTVNSYTLTVNPNGGSWNSTTSNSSFTLAYGSTKTIANPTRTGYAFAGWTVSGGGSMSGTTYTQGASNCTLTAKWTANAVNYTVRHWKMNLSGSGYTEDTASKQTLTANADSTVTLSNLKKSFTGFTYKEGKVGNAVKTTATVLPDGSLVIDLYYTRNQYTVTVNKGTGISSVTGGGTYYYGASVTVNATVGTGYSWKNWTGSSTSTNRQYTFTMGAANVTLTANATVNSYTLTVNPNGGSWNSTTSNSSFTLAYGGTKTIANPTRTGYTFAGWTVSGSGSISGTTYTQGAGNCTLTAKWTVNNYTLTVNPNGGSWNSSTSNSSFTLAYGSTKTIANPTRTGYTFAGWTVTGSGSISGTTYTQGAGNCTLTAKWTPNTIKLTLDAKGGSGHTTTLYFKYGINKFYTDAACTNQITAITRPTRTGYTYDTDMGFYGDGSSGGVNGERYIAYGGVEFAGDLCTDIYKDATLYCQWTVNSYTLTVNPNGGSWNSTTSNSSFTLAYGSTKAIANPTRTGYTFAGWTVSGSGSLSGTTYTQGAGNCTLTAKWTVNNYTLTVNPNGGSWNSTTSNSSFTLAYGSTKTIANPTRTGYTFAGWTVSGSGSLSGTTYTQGAGNCTLTAKWTPIIYTVTYDANGGSGAPGRQEKYHGIDITLSTSKPTKPGYTFTEWNTRADGSGTGYAPGDSYTANASVTLYAQWEAAIEISIITPNAAYGADTEVITSFLISNNSGQHILPSDGIKVSFTVTKSTGTIVTLSKSEVVIPAGETNMVWFKWTVPASVPSSLHLTCTVSDAGGNVLDSDEKSWHTGKAENYQTPDTVFEAAAPQYWVMPSVPVTNNPSAAWWEWVYENGAFEKKEYEAHLETESFILTPDPDILSNYWNGSVWTMRSGYGILMDWKTRFVSTGSSTADAGMYTAAQTAYALFPEFGYAQADGSCRLLDRLSGSFVFPVNPASDDNDRLHYTPLWFPDGTQIYRVAGIAYDCWTPAGMISIVDASGGISIDGSIYDDWYIGRFPR